MSKHTPGPWEEIDGVIWNVDEDGMPGCHAIADIRALDSMQRRRDGALIEANARLIAAAPEMAEALAKILPAFEQMVQEAGHDPSVGMDASPDLDLIEAARAALRKGGVEG